MRTRNTRLTSPLSAAPSLSVGSNRSPLSHLIHLSTPRAAPRAKHHQPLICSHLACTHALSLHLYTCMYTHEHTQHTLINSLSVGGYSKHRHACFNSHSLHTHAHTLRQQPALHPLPLLSAIKQHHHTPLSLAILLQ